MLRDIREIKCSAEFGRHNFTPTSYIDQWNRTQPMYYVTRDGFTLLAMGYTGEKALKFKEGYIKQFSEMEKALTDKNRERIKALTCRMALTEALQQSSQQRIYMVLPILFILIWFTRRYLERMPDSSEKH